MDWGQIYLVDVICWPTL